MTQPSRPKIRVLLADDHPMVVDGIRSCLEVYDHIDVIGTAENGRQAFEKSRADAPDIVLMDINMPEMNGLDTADLFRDQLPDVKLLFLSMHDSREYISRAVQCGARGYVLKDVPTVEIVTAIEAVNNGGTYFSSGVSEILLSDGGAADSPLTDREQAILRLVAEGMSNKLIARHLDISLRTVETHRRNIKRKLDVDSTAGLTRYAIEQGIIEVAKV
ncbi:MAG: response regulator transcription factor [Rhodospirillaceae bacterium]|nr:response regulator transcription factor [Rhodospirillaceae bacterium]MBT5515621.1 response regulator transcription factor [Rhodospirillaceae bacterium]MBT6084719.1 response regulator transcription factor [Rhodospirillaceae bacterium]MBT6607142.1 response regulator transcription factor [Rhodospirillaceae bacterium]MBT6886098.1 response regulator transcription factor [Rhodospirillaceae bacterium]